MGYSTHLSAQAERLFISMSRECMQIFQNCDGIEETSIYAQNAVPDISRTLGKVAIWEVTIGEVPIGETTIGEATIGEVAIGKVTIGEVTIGEIAIGEVAIGEVPIGEVAMRENVMLGLLVSS